MAVAEGGVLPTSKRPEYLELVRFMRIVIRDVLGRMGIITDQYRNSFLYIGRAEFDYR